ncbi:MAG: hypothetical protein JSR73_08200 [Proteobacteria bacterium]|nr:hypothetical protein [Pseudomonadota bacterium]
MIDVDRDCERMRDFLTGRLGGFARQRFERRLARDRSLVADLELVAAFREGLLLLRRGSRTSPVPARVRAAGGEWLLGLAATAALLAGVAVLATRLPARDVLAAAAQAGLHFPRDTRATLTLTSSRHAPIAISRAARSGPVELRVRPGVPDASRRFDLVLVRPGSSHGSAPIAAIRHLAPRADGFVHCYADFEQLGSGRYELVLRPESGGKASVVRYPIEVVPSAGFAAG